MGIHSTDAKGIFFTRRRFSRLGTIEIIFTPTALAVGYLLEGRYRVTNTNGWEISGDRGYFKLKADGTWETMYGGTTTVTDLEANTVVSSYQVNKTYKLEISITADGKFLNSVGTRYDLEEQFRGQIHSIKTTKCYCGYDYSTGINGGKHANLNFQFHRLGDATKPAYHIDTLDVVSEQEVVGAVPTNGWTLSGNTWTQTGGSGWGKRLFIMKTNEAIDGQRTYERILKVTCNAVIPTGKHIGLFYNLPDGGHANKPLKQGYNELYILMESSSKDEDSERPKFDSDNAEGVQISDLKVTEYHGALIQGANWVSVTV